MAKQDGLLHPCLVQSGTATNSSNGFYRPYPSRLLFLVPAGGGVFYGMSLSIDMPDYLTNEFTVHSFEMVTSGEVKKVLARLGSKVWGNKDLIDF